MNLTDKHGNKKLWIIFFYMIFIYIIIGLGVRYFFRLNEYKKYSLDDNVTATICKSDGSVKYFDGNEFDNAVPGDIVLVTVQLPDKYPYRHAALCTTVYNCAVEVSCEDVILYEYGKDIISHGGQLGNIFVIANIPKDSQGKTITMKFEIPRNSYLNKVENIILMPSEQSLRYVLLDHEIDFVFCISIVGFSFCALLILLLVGKNSNVEREGVYLFLFFISVGVWELGLSRLVYIFINNPVICANIEYVAIFCIPIPFGAFFSLEFNKRFRKMFISFTVMYMGVFVAAMILDLTGTTYYYEMVHFERYFIVAGLIAIFIAILLNHDKKTNSEQVIQTGTFFSMLIILLEIIRYELCDISTTFKSLFPVSLVSFGLMIFVFSLLYGYYGKLSDEILKQKNLELVAYTDGMTGISNRTAVDHFLNDLDAKEDYGIVFFDVNDLKKANDVYGHEIGDQLISIVAKTLQISFNENGGFYGRYGGDEFVAGFYSNAESNLEKSIAGFNQLIERANEEKTLPFDIRVAYGIFVNNREKPLKSKDAIKKADDEMYVMKNKMKANETCKEI